MAEPGLVETFRMVFAEKMEEELANQAKNAGKKTASGFESGASSGLESFFKRIAGWLAAAFAVSKVIDFAKESIKAAEESETAWNELGFSLGKVGIKVADVRGEVEKLGQRFLDKTTFGDEAALRGLNSLVQITGDYQLSLRAVEVAADLAAAKHLSLEESSVLVGRALNGNVLQLKRMGVELKEGGGVLDQLSAKFKGAAENELNTFGGKVKQLGEFWNELKEAIGAALIEAGSGTSVMDTLIASIKGLTQWVMENKGAFVALGTAIGNVVDFILHQVIPTFARIGPAWDATVKPFIADAIDLVNDLVKALAFVYRTATPGVSGTAMQLDAIGNHLDGVAAKARKAGEDADAALRRINAAASGGNKLLGTPASTGTSTFIDTTTGTTGGRSGGPDRNVGDAAAKARAAKQAAEDAKKAAEDAKKAAKDLQDALDDAAQSGIDLNEELNANFKAMNTKRLEEIRTEFAAKKDAMDQTALKVLEIAGEEAAKNEEERDNEAAWAAHQHELQVQHWKDLSETALHIADITDDILRMGDAWGIFGGKAGKALADTLVGVRNIADSISGLTAAIASGNPLGIAEAGIGVLGAVGGAVKGLFKRDKDPGRLKTNQELFNKAMSGDDNALQELFLLSGRAQPGEGWATNRAKDDAWSKYQTAKAAIEKQQQTAGGGSQPTGPLGTPVDKSKADDAARAADAAERARLDDIRAGEEEQLRQQKLNEETAAQMKLTSDAKSLSQQLRQMVAAAVAAQRSAEKLGETGPLGFDSPLYRDAKQRADRAFDDAQRAVDDAIAKQTAAAHPDTGTGELTAGFTVQRTITESSAGRLIGEAITTNVWLEKIYNRLGGVNDAAAMAAQAGQSPWSGQLNEVPAGAIRSISESMAKDYQQAAVLSGNARLPV